MENASRALIMAGAVLLSLLLVGLLVYFFSQPGKMYSSIDDKKQAENLQEFNKQFEAFNRNVLYGVDIISAVNKAHDNNEKYNVNGTNNYVSYPEFRIDIEVTITKPRTFVNGSWEEGEPVLPIPSGSSKVYSNMNELYPILKERRKPSWR